MDGDSLKVVMKEAFKEAFKEVLQDEELVASYWHAGFKHFSKHTQEKTTQWIGKQFIVWLGGAALAFGIFIAAKTGYIK